MKTQTTSLNICFSPALLPLYQLKNCIVVIIDIFRASSTICYGLYNGAKAIIPVYTLEECLAYGDKHPEYVLAGEREGRVAPGFSVGNSPFDYIEEKIKGKTIVLSTSNGTAALHLASEAKQIVIGSFLNLSVLCNWLKKQSSNILLVCAGCKNQFNLEDTVFAGALAYHLSASPYVIDDSVLAARDLYLLAKDDLAAYLKRSSHAQKLIKLGLHQDVDLCLQADLCSIIPILEGHQLVEAE